MSRKILCVHGEEKLADNGLLRDKLTTLFSTVYLECKTDSQREKLLETALKTVIDLWLIKHNREEEVLYFSPHQDSEEDAKADGVYIEEIEV